VVPTSRYRARVEEEDGFVYESRLAWDEPGPLAEVVQEMSADYPTPALAPWEPHCFTVDVSEPSGVGQPDTVRGYAALWVPESRKTEAEKLLTTKGVPFEDRV
jgi:hypothetical protein